jgi:hypothetical protein
VAHSEPVVCVEIDVRLFVAFGVLLSPQNQSEAAEIP